MSFSAYVGTLTQPNATTGNQSITGLGFQPKVIIFWSNGNTAAGNSATIQYCLGVAISSSSRRAIYGYSLDAGAAGLRAEATAACIQFGTNTGTVSLADFVSMDSDGFTVNWTTCDATQRIIGFTALGGTDLTNVFLGNAQEKTAPTGNQSYTGVGFQPSTVLIFQDRSGTAAPPVSTSGNGTFNIGILKSSSARSMIYAQTPNAAGGAAKSKQKAVAKSYTNPTLIEADMVSMDADGFTLNYTTAANAARYFFYLAIKGPAVNVGVFNQPTSTGNSAVTGVGFTPSAIVLTSINLVASTAEQAASRFSWGSASGTSSRFASWRGVTDGANPTVVKTRLQTNKVITMATEASGGPTVTAEADLVSFDADGFTLNWTTADATAREVVYWAFGAVASPGVSPPPRIYRQAVNRASSF